MPGKQCFCTGRPPRPRGIGLHRWWRVKQGLNDAPRLLHAVLSGEEHGVPVQGVTEKPLVGLRLFPEFLGEEQREIDGPCQSGTGLHDLHHQVGSGSGIDPQDELVGMRWVLRERQMWRELEDYSYLGRLRRERLAGTDEEWDTRPAPVVDLEP